MTVKVRGPELDEIADLFVEFENLISKTLDEVALDASRLLGKVLVAAGSARMSAVSVDDVSKIPVMWSDAIEVEVLPRLEQYFLISASRQAARIENAFAKKKPDDTLVSTLPEGVASPILYSTSTSTLEHMKTASNRLRGIGDDLWESSRAELVVGLENNESIPHLAKRVQGAAQVTKPRATTIARTEVIAATNGGSLTAIKATKLAGEKTWIATSGKRTRESHQAANGQTVPLDDFFAVGGTTINYPGWPPGQAGEVINCRCTMTYELLTPLETQKDESISTAEMSSPPKKMPAPPGRRRMDDGPAFDHARDRTHRFDPPTPEARAIQDYMGSGYRTINSTLRSAKGVITGIRFTTRARIDDIDSAFDKVQPLEHDLIVHRGMSSRQQVLGNGPYEGKIFTDYGFTSTSTQLDISKGFTAIDSVLINIRVPAGKKIMNVDHASGGHLGYEQELLLPRGTRFKITKTKRVESRGTDPLNPRVHWEMEAEVL